jgi:uncharacterized cofD-like protein
MDARIPSIPLRLPKVVVIGGGTGLSVMLRGLKEKPLDLTAIVTVADDGGSSGVLRQELHIPPPGDIRNVLMALANVEPLLSRLLRYRFPAGSGLAGHSLGNLMLAAMTDIAGDFVSGVRELSQVLAVRGRVLPAAAQGTVLKAVMEDGRTIVGESQIPKARGRISRVMIEPDGVEPLPEAVEAIREADCIVIGPGSLYTSIMPNLLVKGLAEAIVASDALKLFICNVMTQPGETDGYTVGDHLDAIEAHVGAPLFHGVIVNSGEIPPAVLAKYAEEGASTVVCDEEKLEARGIRVIADHLVKVQTYLRHDAEKLSHHIERLVQEWISGKR